MRNLFISCTLCFFLQNIFAQTIIQKDHAIEKMVGEVNADSLKSYINTLVRFGTRQTLSTTNDPKKGIGAAREWIISKFKNFAANSNGRMTVELDKWILPADGKRVDVNADMGNAMAILHGTDTADKRIFIISGHMDSRVTDVMNRTSDAPGANDDGSGTSAVIECARVMSTYSFPATIIFVAVCGEEQGLLGSDHLADKAQKNNWDVEAMLNNDIVGSNNSSETNIIDNTRIRVFSEGLPFFELEKKAAAIRQLGMENDGASRQLARYVKETGERYVANLDVVMIYRNDRFLRGGDHSPFVQRGFTAVRLTEMNENYEHQHQDLRTEKNIKYGDLPEFMDFEYLRKNTALNLCNLANLAKSPSKPEDVKIDVKNLTNSTYLYWKEPKNTKPKGYFVLMRETTAAQWQKKFFTDKTEMRLPYSKDNYFFSVQSVSTDGNESLPVVPSVGR
ncbi:MAG: M28 family metallopeptidase [Bacteroidetes bacterium]|nr:M28 family metallopeptidase [Bacteroidota bacterium]